MEYSIIAIELLFFVKSLLACFALA